MYAAGLTAVGLVRNHNEDVIFYSTESFGPLPNFFVVADGMGGHNAGEVASAKSLEYSSNFILESKKSKLTNPEDILDILITAAMQANNSVFELSVSKPAYYGMGTTFSACSIIGNTIVIAHIGDSRIYTISPGNITQVTTDHTYVEEMVKAGKITREEARSHSRRNILTRVLGCDSLTPADGTTYSLEGVNSILLCSDGLTDMISDEDIMEIINQNTPPKARAEALVSAANNNGGKDNISVIIIDVKGEAH